MLNYRFSQVFHNPGSAGPGILLVFVAVPYDGRQGHVLGREARRQIFRAHAADNDQESFIYRSHSVTGDGREWFVVPARLPEYGNETALEDKTWFDEVFVQIMATFQRSHAPRRIVGRFLPFSDSKIMCSGECCQHGAHIQWEKGHELLVCKTFFIEEGGSFPGIAICGKGSTAEAMCVRKDVKDTLLSLIESDVHGYPGLCFPEFHDSEPLIRTEFQRVIRPCLDITFASLAETSEKISRDSHRMFDATFPSSRNRTEYPRLVLLVSDGPVGDSTGSPESPTATRGVVLLREMWDRWMYLCNGGKRSFHLVFLCEYDLSKVLCGPEGKGYPMQDAASLFKALSPLLQVMKYVKCHVLTQSCTCCFFVRETVRTTKCTE